MDSLGDGGPRSREVDDYRPASGSEDTLDLGESLRNRRQVAEHVGGEDTVEGAVAERKLFSDPGHPVTNGAQAQHLDDGVQGDHLPLPEHLLGGSRATSQVEDQAGREMLGPRSPPFLFVSERQHPIDAVVSTGNPSEDRIRLGAHFAGGTIRSKPV